MEPENGNFSKQTLLKRIVKRPYDDIFLGSSAFGQVSAKYGCFAYI